MVTVVSSHQFDKHLEDWQIIGVFLGLATKWVVRKIDKLTVLVNELLLR